MRQKTVPSCRYVNPAGSGLTPLPWEADRSTVAAALRRSRKHGLLRRQGPGTYMLIGVADQLVRTR